MKRENVLLLCLSKVSFDHGLTTYEYNVSEKEQIKVTGYMTNEPSAKVALSLGDLDRIVVIRTKDARKEKIPKPKDQEKEDEIRNYTLNDNVFPIQTKRDYEKYIALQYTHYEYYETVIKNYAKEKARREPEFCTVDISNNPEEYEIAKAAVDAAEKVLGEKDQTNQTNEIHLYVDFNGGLRYIASMLLNTANLIEQRGATIEKIFTMNFENKDDKDDKNDTNDKDDKDDKKPVAVENYEAVLKSNSLVSGIKEYVDYGRCKELKNYFQGHGEIEGILDKMKTLSDDFQLCDAYSIFDKEKIKSLQNDLRNFNPSNKDDTFGILFKYVATDILGRYKKLFDGVLNKDLPNVIQWCLENDYIQQAVTFYTERMPIYFWDKKIYYPTERELEEYNQIDEACKKIQAFDDKLKQPMTENQKITRELGEHIRRHESLKNSAPNEKVKIKKDIKKDIKNLHTYFLNRDPRAVWMIQYLGNSTQYTWIASELKLWNKSSDYTDVDTLKANGRVRSKIEDKELKSILKEYEEIKDQRNYINHADANGDNSGRWAFDDLVKNLWEYVNHIQNIVVKMDDSLKSGNGSI